MTEASTAIAGSVVQGGPEFRAWTKIPRLNRNMQITEKVDGTNGCIVIVPGDYHPQTAATEVYAQSRKRILPPRPGAGIEPMGDNHGFSAWVYDNRDILIDLLGPGRHYGEWYGSGINGNRYGLDHKRFALFNPMAYGPENIVMESLIPVSDAFIHTVPLLYTGPFDTRLIDGQVKRLRREGSKLTDLPHRGTCPGCGSAHEPYGTKAEGVIVWHEAARQLFKVTLENDERPKGAPEGVNA